MSNLTIFPVFVIKFSLTCIFFSIKAFIFQMTGEGSISSLWSGTIEVTVFDDVTVTGLMIKIQASVYEPEITTFSVAACMPEGM